MLYQLSYASDQRVTTEVSPLPGDFYLNRTTNCRSDLPPLSALVETTVTADRDFPNRNAAPCVQVCVKHAIADVLTGLATLFLFFLADAFLHIAADLRIGLIAIAGLYLGAGLLRGGAAPAGALRKGLLVSIGGVVALLLLTWNGVQHSALAALVITAILFAICGAHARHLPVRRSAAVVFLAFGLFTLAAAGAVPFLAIRMAVRRVATATPAFSFTRPDGASISSADL